MSAARTTSRGAILTAAIVVVLLVAAVEPDRLAAYLPPLQTRRAHPALAARALSKTLYLEDGQPRGPAHPAAADTSGTGAGR